MLDASHSNFVPMWRPRLPKTLEPFALVKRDLDIRDLPFIVSFHVSFLLIRSERKGITLSQSFCQRSCVREVILPEAMVPEASLSTVRSLPMKILN